MKCNMCGGGGFTGGTDARCPRCSGLKVISPLASSEVLQIMEDAQAIVSNGHFVLASGMHSTSYVEKEKLYRRADVTSLLCREIAHRFLNTGQSVQVVATPTGGSYALSQWTAFHLQDPRGPQIFSTYAEKPKGDALGQFHHFAFRQAFQEVIGGRSVLVLDDIWATGEATKKVIDAVHRAGGMVAGAISLVNRGKVESADLGLVAGDIFFSLANVEMKAFSSLSCPLCQAGVPINTDLGHGAKFLAEKCKR